MQKEIITAGAEWVKKHLLFQITLSNEYLLRAPVFVHQFFS